MPNSDWILLVEDDARLRHELREALSDHGFVVHEAESISAAEALLTSSCTLVLLDIGLPDGNGLLFCRTLRKSGCQIPVIMLTAHDAPRDRVEGLDAGADDYVVKPFDIEEVLARIRSVLRRAQQVHTQQVLRRGDIWLDVEAREAGRGSQRLELAPREFELLRFLLEHPGRAWTRDQLLERVWGLRGGIGSSRTIDLHIRKLRQKIGDEDPESRMIATIWGLGYRLNEEPAQG